RGLESVSSKIDKVENFLLVDSVSITKNGIKDGAKSVEKAFNNAKDNIKDFYESSTQTVKDKINTEIRRRKIEFLTRNTDRSSEAIKAAESFLDIKHKLEEATGPLQRNKLTDSLNEHRRTLRLEENLTQVKVEMNQIADEVLQRGINGGRRNDYQPSDRLGFGDTRVVSTSLPKSSDEEREKQSKVKGMDDAARALEEAFNAPSAKVTERIPDNFDDFLQQLNSSPSVEKPKPRRSRQRLENTESSQDFAYDPSEAYRKSLEEGGDDIFGGSDGGNGGPRGSNGPSSTRDGGGKGQRRLVTIEETTLDSRPGRRSRQSDSPSGPQAQSRTSRQNTARQTTAVAVLEVPIQEGAIVETQPYLRPAKAKPLAKPTIKTEPIPATEPTLTPELQPAKQEQSLVAKLQPRIKPQEQIEPHTKSQPQLRPQPLYNEKPLAHKQSIETKEPTKRRDRLRFGLDISEGQYDPTYANGNNLNLKGIKFHPEPIKKVVGDRRKRVVTERADIIVSKTIKVKDGSAKESLYFSKPRRTDSNFISQGSEHEKTVVVSDVEVSDNQVEKLSYVSDQSDDQ
ncbi:MAG: hypothetical protein SGJ02_10810, partial [bacterium]|nr:hypothetical protein [bacterium]